jgi:hypothetical protein
MGVRALSVFAASKLSGYLEGVIESFGMLTVLIAAPVILLVLGALLLVLEGTLTKMEFAADPKSE